MKTESLAAEAIALTKAAGKEWGWEDFEAIAAEIENEQKEEINNDNRRNQ